MKKYLAIIALTAVLSIAPTKKSHAIVWVVVKAAIKKVIKALDLQVQRLQNKTIALQNAQKALENEMSKLQLDQITDWVSKHKEQYAQYFDELHKVKDALSNYTKVKNIMEKQVQIVNEYKKAFNLLRQDKHFTPVEVNYMLNVYTGIVDESLKNIDRLFLVTSSFKTQMTDGKRLQVINSVDIELDKTLIDVREFNRQNVILSLQRSKDALELEQVRHFYGWN